LIEGVYLVDNGKTMGVCLFSSWEVRIGIFAIFYSLCRRFLL